MAEIVENNWNVLERMLSPVRRAEVQRSNPLNAPDVCIVCSTEAEIYTCSTCSRDAIVHDYYCSRSCQKADWKRHRVTCGAKYLWPPHLAHISNAEDQAVVKFERNAWWRMIILESVLAWGAKVANAYCALDGCLPTRLHYFIEVDAQGQMSLDSIRFDSDLVEGSLFSATFHGPSSQARVLNDDDKWCPEAFTSEDLDHFGSQCWPWIVGHMVSLPIYYPDSADTLHRVLLVATECRYHEGTLCTDFTRPIVETTMAWKMSPELMRKWQGDRPISFLPPISS
ncbi:hypothetical protein M408DRAFT_30233 [Serendipita vermifera MAFF 305830]|uniref:MYND-type domain-containing protein n=1 Tax=Serendipita vermifera MAFF 305830 TaxID=933852 RepID=A0A0C2WSV9_SERVB|nr:hypothetical protein M408DRAFT_30233 [Serendipita vermifera MAFF 305830]